jgi:hypothetical protein
LVLSVVLGQATGLTVRRDQRAARERKFVQRTEWGRILEIDVEPGDRKVIVKLDDKQPERAEVEVEREDGAPLKSVESLRKVAA